jgi:hypothetical protein
MQGPLVGNSHWMCHPLEWLQLVKLNYQFQMFLLSRHTYPKNNTPFGFLATNKSMIVAALGEPIPKFMMLSPCIIGARRHGSYFHLEYLS